MHYNKCKSLNSYLHITQELFPGYHCALSLAKSPSQKHNSLLNISCLTCNSFLCFSNFILPKLSPTPGPGITALSYFIIYLSLYHLVTLLVVIRLMFYRLLYIYGHSAFMSLLLSPSS